MRYIYLLPLAVLLSTACKDDTTVVEPPDPVTAYSVAVESTSGQPLGAVSLALGNTSGNPTIITATGLSTHYATVGGQLRLLAVGTIATSKLFDVSVVTADTPPTVTVLDASAGAAANFARLTPAQVKVTVTAKP